MAKTICIVDDEEELVENLRLELLDLHPDWDVQAFTNGFDAQRLILEGKVDLLLTDIAMPDMDGYELYWHTKAYNPAIPVIMMTGFGYDPNHVLVRAKKDGLQEVVFKPFDVEMLARRIEQLLGFPKQ